VLNPPSQSATAQAATQQLGLPTEASTRTGLPSGSALEPSKRRSFSLASNRRAPQQFRESTARIRFSSRPKAHSFAATRRWTSRCRRHGRHGSRSRRCLHQLPCTVTRYKRQSVPLAAIVSESRRHFRFPWRVAAWSPPFRPILLSTKIVNVGGSIGTITGDHLTAVTGRLGAAPTMIPLDLTLQVSGAEPAKQRPFISSLLIIRSSLRCL